MSGFEVVVVVAKGIELVQSGMSSLRPGLSVVVFDSNTPASLHRAGRGLPRQGDLLRDGGTAAKVRDVEHIDTTGDNQFQDGLPEQPFGDRHWDGSDAADLAEFVGDERPATQGFYVHAEQRKVTFRNSARPHRLNQTGWAPSCRLSVAHRLAGRLGLSVARVRYGLP